VTLKGYAKFYYVKWQPKKRNMEMSEGKRTKFCKN